MKRLSTLLALVLMATITGFSQAPAMFNYQGVARNSVGNVLVNKNISLRLTIRDGSAAGPAVYSETRSVVTNPFGLFNVQVGSPGATSVTGSIPGVPWATGNKYIQVEIDPNGGSSFINIGTAQLASVPYAWHSQLSNDLTLPFIKTQAEDGTLFRLTNSGTTANSSAIEGVTNSTSGAAFAIKGTVSSLTPGGFSAGVIGQNNGASGLGIGVMGQQNGSGWGVYGTTPSGIGVYGLSTSGIGVQGISTSGTGGRFISSTGLALHTSGGGVRLQNINEAVNRILATTDGTGNATWQDPSAVGIVTGSGTLNFIPKWTPTGTNLGNSQIFDNGTNVGIGTTTPTARFSVNELFKVTSTGTVQYANSVNPMINMFETGTTNADRMVIAHSPGFQTWGLQYQDASDKFNFLSAGVGVLTADLGTQRVGIGTISPVTKLHVVGNAASSAIEIIHNQNNAGFSSAWYLNPAGVGVGHFGYGNPGAPLWANQMFAGSIAAIPFVFTTSDIERMRITAAGDLGVGTTNPGTRLHVVANAASSAVEILHNQNNTGFSSSWYLNTGGSLMGHFGYANPGTFLWANQMFAGSIAPIPFVLTTSDIERVRISATGNVGIGTTSPLTRLHVSGQTTIQDGTQGINRIFADNGAGIGTGEWRTLAGIGIVSGSGTLNFVAKWTPDGNTLGNSQIFDNGTNVGVGIITPTEKLHMLGRLQIDHNPVTISPAALYVDEDFRINSQDAQLALYSQQNGNASGAISFKEVDVAGNLNNQWALQRLTNGGFDIGFGTGIDPGTVSSVVRALSNGNVGIGIITPSAKLEVNNTSAAALTTVEVNQTNTANTANAMNVFDANISNGGYGNAAIRGIRGGGSLGSTFLWITPTAITGIAGTGGFGIGVQGTTEVGFGISGIAYNGTGVVGSNDNSGSAGHFETFFNASNSAPTVEVVNISTVPGAYGLRSTITSSSPGGFSAALRGQNNGTGGLGIGVWGSQNGAGWGVYGTTPNGIGVFGTGTNNGYGVWGTAVNGIGVVGQSSQWYGVWGETNSTNGNNNAGTLGFASNTTSTNFTRGVWGWNNATNNDGAGGLFNHVSGGYGVYGATGNNGTGVYGVTGTNGTGVFGESFGVNSRGVRGQTDLGFAGLFESTNTTSINATLRVNDPNITTGNIFRKSAIYAELTPPVPGSWVLASPTAIKGVASTSATVDYTSGAGVQGSSRSGVGTVGITDNGVGVLAWAVNPAGYGLQTFGKVMINGLNAGTNRILTSLNANGDAEWRDAAAIGLVGGSGTVNFVPKWTPSGVLLGNSQIVDNGTSVGIGTTTPSAAAVLDIRKNFAQMRILNTADAADVWISSPSPSGGYTGGIGTLSNHGFPIFTNSLDRVMVTNTGRVGIGTLTPTAFTEIVGNSVVGTPHLKLTENSDDYGRLTLRNVNANNSGNNFWDIAGYTNDNRFNERLNIYNNATGDLVSITGDGRVGIGHFNPFVKTHINSGTSIDNLLLDAQSATNAGPHQYFYSNGQFGIIDYIRTDYTVGAEAYRRGALEVRGFSRLNLLPTNAVNLTSGMTILSNGNVGIGTATPTWKVSVSSPVAVLQVLDSDDNADIYLLAAGAGYTGGVGTTTNHDLPIFTSNVDRLTVKAATGDVGIATFTPAGRLHLISRPNSPGLISEANYTTPAPGIGRYGNLFTSLNTDFGVAAKTGALWNSNVPPAIGSAIMGMDTSNAGLSHGVTGYSVSNLSSGSSGVYGYSSLGGNPTSTGYLTGYTGGSFFGGDHGVLGAVWNTVSQLDMNGSQNNKAGLVSYVATNPHLNTNYGLYVLNVSGGAINYAGYFNGNVQVNGNFTASGVKAFKIDHPLDPANKYLSHYAVESPEVQNVYNGNTKTDATGKATIVLPDYFQVINTDFKYQLTIIDESQFAMARVSRKITGNSFEIMTSVPSIEVSWQVTAVRNDKAVEKFAVPAVTDKLANEKGKYLNPDLYGKSADQAIHSIKEPKMPSGNEKTPLVPVNVTVPQKKNLPVATPVEQSTELSKEAEEIMKNWAKPIEKPKKDESKPAVETIPKKVLTEEQAQLQAAKEQPTKPIQENKQTTPTLGKIITKSDLPKIEVTAEENQNKQKQADQKRIEELKSIQSQKPVTHESKLKMEQDPKNLPAEKKPESVSSKLGKQKADDVKPVEKKN